MKNWKAVHFLLIFAGLLLASVSSQALETDKATPVPTTSPTATLAITPTATDAKAADKVVEKAVDKPVDKKADKKSDKVTIAYFTQKKAAEFEKTIKPLFLSHDSGCKNCEIVNETPYAADGSVDVTALTEKVKSLSTDQVNFLFFDFNLKAVAANKALVEALNKKEDEHLILVSAAGIPADGDASGPLSRTVIGQVHDAVIIGELSEKDRLTPTNSFYGPEMLTALRPPKELIGQGVAPLLFTAALAQHWTKRKPQGWLDYFKNKKMRNRRIWLEFGDFF